MEEGLIHLLVTVFLTTLGGVITMPVMTDISIAALCPGKDQCSLAIYLSGFSQVMSGVGSVLMTPLIGNLSDRYGRKALITLPLMVSVIPQVILASGRDRRFYYAYYVVKILAHMAGEGSFHCLALAYVTDKVPFEKRTSAFGLLAGVGSASFVCGTLAARFIPTHMTFTVAAVLSMIGLVYMRIFLDDTVPAPAAATMKQPLLKEGAAAQRPCLIQHSDEDHSSSNSTPTFKKLPSLGDFICMLKCSPTFSQAAVVLFFNSLADGGLMASLLYFLKARFQFDKNQFADLMVISGIGATLTQLLLMPILIPALGEEKLLSTGLLVSCINMFVYSISWAGWVPYALAGCSIFGVFVRPSICSIASKQVGPNEQGMVQGCLSGVGSMAQIISPLIFSPLTALFLSEEAPFYFPGFSIMCIGLAMVVAFIQSLMIRAAPPIGKISSGGSSRGCTDTLV
ncbi:hypothetical protein PIB30_004475 [Stylosanthes scabra]|uniref:Major facilitator superfamily (MFS) profile domain-containing protein n=1 Tax=Stylosanthes scabra TaxID=79078 RepID=A0ABU6W1U0_9FABA|nr:hypothetical protein [Stylosanthes scabra]